MSENTTPTPSLRRRVTVATIGLVAALLIVVGIVFDVVFGARLTDDLDDQMADLFYDAPALVEAGLNPQEVVYVLQEPDFHVQVIGADGTVYGDPDVSPAPRHAHPLPGPVPDTADTGGAPTPLPWGDLPSMKVTGELPDGSLLTIQADTTGISRTRAAMRRNMAVGAIATLIVAALAVRLVAGRALSPLQRLTATADGITDGDRGRRLRPDRPGTELGHAAEAFDRMLDALESAEDSAKAAAAAAQRAEAQSRRFLSDAAHELRTPLAGIQVVAEQLITATTRPDAHNAGGGPNPRALRHAELLGNETRRATRLVNDLLDIARIDAGLSLRPERTDLARIADNEVERTAMLAPEVDVRRTGDHHLYVEADPTKIAQILTNLLDNARRHTPSSGTITVDVESLDGTAHVTVSDTGPGVADEDRLRIFDRLVRLDDARDRDSGGAGLGLPIARALAEAHHGTLECLPSDGGAVFRLSLPTGPAAETPSVAAR